MRYPLVADRVFERPLLIEERKLNAILAVLGPRMGFELPAQAQRQAWDDGEYGTAEEPSRYVIDRGVARIKVVGTLVHRSLGMSGWSGLLSYEELTIAFREALVDERVKAIFFEIDSGGGEADGCFDLADEIFAARGVKPMAAIAKDAADSAAYLIAAATEHVVVTQSGEVGSVGVMQAAIELSKQNEMLGVAVTYIYAGEHKVDGRSGIPLSSSAKKRFQADVDKTYLMFVDKVARFRAMTAKDVIATQALTYIGDDAVTVGFADEVSTLDAAIDSLADEAQPPAEPQIGPAPGAEEDAETSESDMTDKPTPAGIQAAAPKPTAQPAPVDVDQIRLDAAAATKKRIGDIMGLDEAKGRDELAKHLAFSTELTVDQVKAALGAAPKPMAAAPPAKPNALEAAMQNQPNPQVGADRAEGEGGGADDMAKVSAVTGVYLQGKTGATPTARH